MAGGSPRIPCKWLGDLGLTLRRYIFTPGQEDTEKIEIEILRAGSASPVRIRTALYALSFESESKPEHSGAATPAVHQRSE